MVLDRCGGDPLAPIALYDRWEVNILYIHIAIPDLNRLDTADSRALNSLLRSVQKHQLELAQAAILLREEIDKRISLLGRASL